MNSKKTIHNKGFTLVELMIVVAIIGILASFAVSMHKLYVARSQLSEAFTMADGLKTKVTEFYMVNGVWPSNDAASPIYVISGLPDPEEMSGQFVDEIVVNDMDGHMIILMKNYSISPEISGQNVNFTPLPNGSSFNWECRTNINDNVRPSYCIDI